MPKIKADLDTHTQLPFSMLLEVRILKEALLGSGW